MTPACSVFIATSLDGFIARPDGAIDWLTAANARVPAGEDCGYARFMSTVDALVMGRRTFEQVLEFPEWPYADLRLYVLSRTMTTLPRGAPGTVELVSETPERLVRRLAAHGCRRAYIDGGRTIQSFLRAGLITDLTITTIPVLIGAGLPLFASVGRDVLLERVSTTAFPFGFVQSTYRVAPPATAGG